MKPAFFRSVLSVAVGAAVLCVSLAAVDAMPAQELEPTASSVPTDALDLPIELDKYFAASLFNNEIPGDGKILTKSVRDKLWDRAVKLEEKAKEITERLRVRRRKVHSETDKEKVAEFAELVSTTEKDISDFVTIVIHVVNGPSGIDRKVLSNNDLADALYEKSVKILAASDWNHYLGLAQGFLDLAVFFADPSTVLKAERELGTFIGFPSAQKRDDTPDDMDTLVLMLNDMDYGKYTDLGSLLQFMFEKQSDPLSIYRLRKLGEHLLSSK